MIKYILSGIFIFIYSLVFSQINHTDSKRNDIQNYTKSASHSHCRLPSISETKSLGVIKLDSMITTFENASNSIIKSKVIYKYSSDGNMILEVKSDKLKNSKNWIRRRKTEVDYSTNPYTTSYQHYNWDTLNQQWNLHQKYTTTYDSINNKTIDKSWSWDINQNPVSYALTETDYNSDSMPIMIKRFSNINDFSSTWNSISTTSLTYNGRMKLIQKSSYTSNVQSGKLYYRYKIVYNYINDSILQSYTSFSWDTLNSQWVNSRKLVYSYDYYGKQIKNIDYYYESNEWKKFWKSTYTYDINNNLSFETAYWCDNSTNLWAPRYKYERFYDNNYAFSDLILPTGSFYLNQDEINYFQHLVTKHRHYDYSTYFNKWVKNDEHIYFYSTLNNEKKDIIVQGEIRVYPNPASDYIMIEVDNTYNNNTLYLYDAAGNIVLKHKLSDNKRIPVYFLSQGIYSFSIQADYKTFTGKIIIAR